MNKTLNYVKYIITQYSIQYCNPNFVLYKKVLIISITLTNYGKISIRYINIQWNHNSQLGGKTKLCYKRKTINFIKYLNWTVGITGHS